METIISYFDNIGKYIRKVDSDYLGYREGDRIGFDHCIYEVRSVLHNERTGIKTVNAYMILPLSKIRCEHDWYEITVKSERYTRRYVCLKCRVIKEE